MLLQLSIEFPKVLILFCFLVISSSILVSPFAKPLFTELYSAPANNVFILLQNLFTIFEFIRITILVLDNLLTLVFLQLESVLLRVETLLFVSFKQQLHQADSEH